MPWLSQQERQRYGLELTGFLRYVLLGLSLVLADYSLFWLLDLVRHQMQGEIVARGEHQGVPPNTPPADPWVSIGGATQHPPPQLTHG